MIPIGLPTVSPAVTVGELFGPLAPFAVAGVLVALLIVLALTIAEYRSRRAPEGSSGAQARSLGAADSSPFRPAA